MWKIGRSGRMEGMETDRLFGKLFGMLAASPGERTSYNFALKRYGGWLCIHARTLSR